MDTQLSWTIALCVSFSAFLFVVSSDIQHGRWWREKLLNPDALWRAFPALFDRLWSFVQSLQEEEEAAAAAAARAVESAAQTHNAPAHSQAKKATKAAATAAVRVPATRGSKGEFTLPRHASCTVGLPC